MKLKYILPRVILLSAFFAILLFSSGPSLADDLSITGNGSGSQNNINTSSSNSTTVEQSNSVSFDNEVDASANTGGNSGGGSTGDASTNVSITNTANVNQAQVGCCGTPTPTTVATTPTATPGAGGTITPTITTTTTTIDRPSAVGGVSVSGGAGGVEDEVEGMVAGVSAEILPISGSNTTLGLILISTLMLATGIYLRLKANQTAIRLLKL